MQNITVAKMIDHDRKFIHVHIHRAAGASIEKFFNNPTLYDHRRPEDYVTQYGQDVWNDYFTFALVRNPWAKMVSHYMWRQQRAWWYAQGDELDFEQWVKNFDMLTEGNRSLADTNNSQWDWVTGDDNIMITVDYVAKVEELNHGVWKNICQGVEIDYQPLPRFNSTTHKHYSQYYNKETKEIVAKRYAKDIAAFGYEFEDQEAEIDKKLEALGYL